MTHSIKYYILSILLLTSLGTKSQSCLFDGQNVEVDGYPTADLFGPSSAISLTDDSLLLDGEAMYIIDSETHEFDNLVSLEEFLDCSFYISRDFNSDISGSVQSFSLDAMTNENDIHKLDYVTFRDYNLEYHFIFINKTFLYEFTNSNRFVSSLSKYFKFTEGSSLTLEYVLPSEISGTTELTFPAIYETVTEQVLTHERYDSAVITPPIFTTGYTPYYHEVSSCPDAEYEEVDIEVLKASYFQYYQPVDPIFEVVTEYVLVSNAYEGPHIFPRETISIDTVEKLHANKLDLTFYASDCQIANFLKCCLYNVDGDTLIEISDVGTVYPVCPEGYQSADIYCYNDYTEVPAEYATRSYTKLSTPGSANTITQPATYQTVTVQRITNKDELDLMCIENEYDSLLTTFIVEPATVTFETVPTQYGTREYQILLEAPVFSAIPSEEKIDTITFTQDPILELQEGYLSLPQSKPYCMFQAIRDRLKEEGYLMGNIPLNTIEFYQAIVNYQVENQIPIGAIDMTFLHHLNVEF